MIKNQWSWERSTRWLGSHVKWFPSDKLLKLCPLLHVALFLFVTFTKVHFPVSNFLWFLFIGNWFYCIFVVLWKVVMNLNWKISLLNHWRPIHRVSRTAIFKLSKKIVASTFNRLLRRFFVYSFVIIKNLFSGGKHPS